MVAVSNTELIVIGNDLCILYMRTHYRDCALRNSDSGKLIWQWAERTDPDAEIVERDRRCEWGDTGDHVGEHRLPMTATQFRLNRRFLSGLFAYLDELGRR